MSLFEKLLNALSETASSMLAAVVEAVRTVFEGDPETRRKVSFSIAIIALSAKMAKADGVVSHAEVEAFRQIFDFPTSEARNVARLYDLARQDVAGFEAYAEQLARLCSSCENDCPILENVLDGLFHIAKADGLIHEAELAFLTRVGEIFAITGDRFEQVLARHVYREGRDPYEVLGVSRQDDFAKIRQHYRGLVKENHPDRLIARGVPTEFHGIAHNKMAALNAAYRAIERERKAA